MHPRTFATFRCLLLLTWLGATASAADPWVEYAGQDGPGKGKHVVLVSGDEEYRSEEALPQLGKILAKHHGFKCTVLFAIDPEDGTINPNLSDNIPGLEHLATADLVIFATRFRNLPDEQMKHVVDYVDSGRPIIGLRTATHAFNLPESRPTAATAGAARSGTAASAGRCWARPGSAITASTASRARAACIAPDAKSHPILRGIKDGDIWGPTDVYGVRLPLPGDSQPLVLGQVLEGMKPTDQAAGEREERPDDADRLDQDLRDAEGKRGRVFTTTMGASQDLDSEGLRRLLVNACYWALGLEDQIPEKSNVDLVGDYKPLPFSFGGFEKGLKPSDHARR